MKLKPSKRMYMGVCFVIAILTGIYFSTVRGAKPAMSGMPGMPGMSSEIAVSATQVIKRDTPISYEFVGTVRGKDEVKIMAKVSGNIVAKMVKGGDTVYKGQPLFRIDNKQYISSIRSAQATLRQSQSTLNNTKKDLARYQRLAAVQGVAQQTVDAQVAQAEQNEADVETNLAKVQSAREDEQDTLILSPVDGRIDVNDVSVGAYIAAGSTTLASVSSIDPVWVEFTMSENEYLKLARLGNGTVKGYLRDLKLILSDGQEYAQTGQIAQIDKGIDDNTGSITIKAIFNNPQKLLIPGMFAKVVAVGEVRQGAILIPEKAVKELLDKKMVVVVTDENKAETRAVKLGAKVGNMYIVEEGLTGNERIVVDGIDKAKQGASLKVTMVDPDSLPNPDKQ